MRPSNGSIQVVRSELNHNGKGMRTGAVKEGLAARILARRRDTSDKRGRWFLRIRASRQARTSTAQSCVSESDFCWSLLDGCEEGFESVESVFRTPAASFSHPGHRSILRRASSICSASSDRFAGLLMWPPEVSAKHRHVQVWRGAPYQALCPRSTDMTERIV
jgi:hypothetical protein